MCYSVSVDGILLTLHKYNDDVDYNCLYDDVDTNTLLTGGSCLESGLPICPLLQPNLAFLTVNNGHLSTKSHLLAIKRIFILCYSDVDLVDFEFGCIFGNFDHKQPWWHQYDRND